VKEPASIAKINAGDIFAENALPRINIARFHK